jgi:hypothetical protein
MEPEDSLPSSLEPVTEHYPSAKWIQSINLIRRFLKMHLNIVLPFPLTFHVFIYPIRATYSVHHILTSLY